MFAATRSMFVNHLTGFFVPVVENRTERVADSIVQ
jgi:hypothetical protein